MVFSRQKCGSPTHVNTGFRSNFFVLKSPPEGSVGSRRGRGYCEGKHANGGFRAALELIRNAVMDMPTRSSVFAETLRQSKIQFAKANHDFKYRTDFGVSAFDDPVHEFSHEDLFRRRKRAARSHAG